MVERSAGAYLGRSSREHVDPRASKDPSGASLLENDEGFGVWRRALEALLKQGATYAEAIEGANLILRAYLRERASDEGGG